MKNLLAITVILATFLMGACNSGSSKKSGAGEEENDSILINKEYHSTGGLWKVTRGKKVDVKGTTQYVRDGESLEYYKTPKNALASKANYKDGKRDGIYTKYHTNGKVYFQVPYVDGKMDGVKKTYYKDGKLQAETPYKLGCIGQGTKEYSSTGNELPNKTLKVWTKKNGSSVTVYAKVLSNGKITKRAEFFEGMLIEGNYWHKNLKKMTVKNGVAEVTLNNPEFVVISAKVKSARNNVYLLTKNVNL